jgi:imidazolonepropionase
MTDSLALMATLGCTQMGMTPAEALRAVTLDAARAIMKETEVGSMKPGKLADLVRFDAPSFRYVPYHFGFPLVSDVWKEGERVVNSGLLTREGGA